MNNFRLNITNPEGQLMFKDFPTEAELEIYKNSMINKGLWSNSYGFETVDQSEEVLKKHKKEVAKKKIDAGLDIIAEISVETEELTSEQAISLSQEYDMVLKLLGRGHLNDCIAFMQSLMPVEQYEIDLKAFVISLISEKLGEIDA